MPIVAPGSRIGSSVRMKGLKVQKGKGGRSMLVYLNLTPMIDMFTILVVFLLMTFSATGEILFTQKDIQLPRAFADKPLERVPIIGISQEVILVEGEKVMFTSGVQEKNYPDAKLPELAKMLKRLTSSSSTAIPCRATRNVPSAGSRNRSRSSSRLTRACPSKSSASS